MSKILDLGEYRRRSGLPEPLARTTLDTEKVAAMARYLRECRASERREQLKRVLDSMPDDGRSALERSAFAAFDPDDGPKAA